MKIKLLLLITFTIFINVNAQIGFQSNIISTEVTSAKSVCTADLDGDGDPDVICSGRGTITWYENIDGRGAFGNPKIISQESVNNVSGTIKTYDLDGDGDMDVLLNTGYRLIWFENRDGLGDFGDTSLPRVIAESSNTGDSFTSTDLDGDNDLDVIFSENNLNINHIIYWGKNIGTHPWYGISWAAPIGITSTTDYVSSIHSTDMDSDGDSDLILSFRNITSWYKNTDGKGTFSIHLIDSHESLVFTRDVSSADINGDGHQDVLSVIDNYQGVDRIVWYENKDGLGDLESEKTIATRDKAFGSLYPADVDGDGDTDIITLSTSNDTVSWYENLNGLGDFSNEQNIATNINYPTAISTADIDGDGDLDVVSSSLSDNTIAWHENLGLLGNTINGIVRIDENMNECDTDDLPVPNLMITTKNNDSNSFASFTQNNGNYTIHTNPGDFTTSVTVNIPDYFTLNPSSHSSNFIGLSNSDTADFCLQPTQIINDVSITLLPTREARPGFDAAYQLVYHNVGTTQLSGDVILEFDDSKLTFLSAGETVSSQTTNSLTFNYSGLNPFETRTIDLNFNVLAPPTTNIGDILSFTATINPVSGDNTENDNVFTLNQTVIGSYDPNDIQVLEGDQILIDDADEYLHYIIRFQNTGTASAINVKVNNILDANLDWTTMQLESSSHSNRVEIKDENEVSFIFNGIYLPDSTTDEPNSHGFIAYKIKPKSSIIVGDIMPNQADIFFDFNPAIITNMVTTEVTNSLSAEDNLISKFYVSPNPTTGVLNINSTTQISKLEVYNNIGQVVLSELNKTSIDVSSLNTGLYFIKIEDANGIIETKKIVKK